ncbi:MAG: hypothetical protein JSR76_01305, partial [Verrucomicrobia bacterium]|nr:hypothetical protein [Verrucomicrobiota bacterium]
MAILTREALKYPLFREIVKSTSFNRPKTNLQEASTQRQSNQLLHPDSKYYYPKAIGIKTGYTKAAKYNLIAAATDGERTLIAALHQNPNSLARYEDARHLFEAAFSEKKVHRLLFKQDETVFNKAIPHAKSELKARIAEDIFIDFYPSEEIHPRAELEWLTPNLPITKDSVVGNLSIRNERNEEILKVALHAEAAVTKQWRYHMTEDLIPSLWKSPLPSLTTLPFLVFLVYKKRKKKL